MIIAARSSSPRATLSICSSCDCVDSCSFNELQRCEQFPDHELGPAAQRADAHPQSLELPRRGDLVGVPSEHHQGLRAGEAPDQLQPVSLGELHPLLHQGEVRRAAPACGDESLHVLHRTRSRDVDDPGLPARGTPGDPLHDRVVVPLGRPGEEARLEVAEAGLGVAEGEERPEHAQGAEEEERLDPRREPARISSPAEEPSLAVGRRHRAGTLTGFARRWHLPGHLKCTAVEETSVSMCPVGDRDVPVLRRGVGVEDVRPEVGVVHRVEIGLAGVVDEVEDRPGRAPGVRARSTDPARSWWQ